MLDTLNLYSMAILSATNGPSSIPYETRKAVLMAFTILMVIASIAMIIVVLMQKGTNDNVGVITGASDTFYGKNKQKGKESLLKKITLGIFVFIIVCAIIAFTVGIID